MQLLLTTTKKTAASRWICRACRGITQRTVHSTTKPGRHNLKLRDGGPARTRFAPSPTGNIHLGSLRTALFNYLVAKATGGQFILRIEDTDQKRTKVGAEASIYEDLEWAGIQWDEGPGIGGPYGPYRQSQRTAIYQEHAQQLLDSGHAYRCFCSATRLNELTQHRKAIGLSHDYDRRCAHIPREESDDRAAKKHSHVIRLKVPSIYPVVPDLTYGPIRTRAENTTKKLPKDVFEDPILLKSDGFPTYHLANVVDDHLMEITHVIRGAEWMSSTPKHAALYQAFGWKSPLFAHVGLLMDGKEKLSKRAGAITISSYRDEGIFPETLTNFVALLGWSHNEKKDVMSMEELIENASMKYTTGNPVLTFEKLRFLQRHHAARYASLPSLETPPNPSHSLMELAAKPIYQLLKSRQHSESQDFSFFNSAFPDESSILAYIDAIVRIDALNYDTPTGFLNRNIYFFATPTETALENTVKAIRLRAVPKEVEHQVSPRIIECFNAMESIDADSWNLENIQKHIQWIINQGSQISFANVPESTIEAWDEESLVVEFQKSVEKAWTKLVHRYLRWAISAGENGPAGALTISLLGRAETLKRLERAGKIMQEHLADVAVAAVESESAV